MSDRKFPLTQEEFVREFADLKEDLLNGYFSDSPGVSRKQKMIAAGLSSQQMGLMKNVCDDLLRDALYTILMGLDGAAMIHQHQITYKLFDEENNELTGNGELSSLAYEMFQEESI